MRKKARGKRRGNKRSRCDCSMSRGALPSSRSVLLRTSDPRPALQRLRVVGDFLENREDDVENIDYALSPIKDLSTTARSLDCTIALREAGPNSCATWPALNPRLMNRFRHCSWLRAIRPLSVRFSGWGVQLASKCALPSRFPTPNVDMPCSRAGSRKRTIGERLYAGCSGSRHRKLAEKVLANGLVYH